MTTTNNDMFLFGVLSWSSCQSLFVEIFFVVIVVVVVIVIVIVMVGEVVVLIVNRFSFVPL